MLGNEGNERQALELAETYLDRQARQRRRSVSVLEVLTGMEKLASARLRRKNS